MDRPGWNKLVQSIEVGKVSVIVVWRLDRLQAAPILPTLA
jgi:DNA invertase Pin-like site-specific DNA recombinase